MKIFEINTCSHTNSLTIHILTASLLFPSQSPVLHRMWNTAATPSRLFCPGTHPCLPPRTPSTIHREEPRGALQHPVALLPADGLQFQRHGSDGEQRWGREQPQRSHHRSDAAQIYPCRFIQSVLTGDYTQSPKLHRATTDGWGDKSTQMISEPSNSFWSCYCKVEKLHSDGDGNEIDTNTKHQYLTAPHWRKILIVSNLTNTVVPPLQNLNNILFNFHFLLLLKRTFLIFLRSSAISQKKTCAGNSQQW